MSMAAQPTELLSIDVPMRDGVTLAALRLCATADRAPTVVSLTPYRKEPWAEVSGPRLADMGFNVVVADVRGIGTSGGSWDGPVSPREITDGVELLEWVAEQQWSDGQTALVGPSYLGLNALLITARKPRGLRCIVSSVPPGDLYRDWIRRGGIPSHSGWGAALADRNLHRPATQQEILRDYYLATGADPFDNERFRRRSAEYVLGDIEVPALITGGWYDFFLRGTIRTFRGISSPKRLLVGNWGHITDDEMLQAEIHGWLDFWLNGRGDDPSSGERVVLQTVGSGAWGSYPDWPDPSRISWERWTPITTPQTVMASAAFTTPPDSVSPVDPLEHSGGSGMSLWGETWTAEMPAASAATRLRGPVALTVVIQSEEVTDFDLHARLSVVGPEGEVRQITEGRLRASHRAVDLASSEFSDGGEIVVPWHPHTMAEPVPLGEPIALDVEIFPVNLELAPGEALRLGITILRVDNDASPAPVSLLPTTTLRLPAA